MHGPVPQPPPCANLCPPFPATPSCPILRKLASGIWNCLAWICSNSLPFLYLALTLAPLARLLLILVNRGSERQRGVFAGMNQPLMLVLGPAISGQDHPLCSEAAVSCILPVKLVTLTLCGCQGCCVIHGGQPESPFPLWGMGHCGVLCNIHDGPVKGSSNSQISALGLIAVAVLFLLRDHSRQCLRNHV